jgi:hypothetical protein
MTPRTSTGYKLFFEPDDLKRIIEDPGQIRPTGWDLTTRGRARIVKGEYLEISSAERKRIQVYEDGSVLVRVSGDEDFLSWGQKSNNFDQAPRLNTNLKVELKNAFFGEAKLFLIPHPVSSWAFAMTDDRYPAPEPSMVRNITVATDELKTNPNVAAYTLIRQIFYWFGVESGDIPYTSVAPSGSRFVDENLIINSRSS